jgi:hypothetical protein
MKNIEENKVPTIEEALKDPAHARFHEVLRYVQNKPSSELMPKKHELILTDLVEMKAKKLYTETPNLPMKKVITTIFESLTDDISAPLVLKLTQKIIDVWENCSLMIQKEKAVAA